jgi:hypothetical protein
MATQPYATVQDLVDAISVDTFMAIFDDARIGDLAAVMESTAVTLNLRRAHAQVASRMPALYSAIPAEQPDDAHVSDLLRDAELAFAVVYAYRRHPEYVRTFGAGPNGPLWEEALDTVTRIQTTVARIAANDNPPQPLPANVGGLVLSSGPRMTTEDDNGNSLLGDF